MDDMVFFKELIKRQARMMLGLELQQDAEEDKRIGYWVGRDDNKCAKGISFILEDDFVAIEMMIIKPDYRQEVLLDKTVPVRTHIQMAGHLMTKLLYIRRRCNILHFLTAV